MNKIIVCFQLILFLSCCYGQSDSKKNKIGYATKDIPVIAIRHSIICQALDSVISYEKRCPSYHVPLIIGFTVRDSTFWFTNYPEILDKLNWTTYKGCLKYKDHFFLSDDISKTWFENTEQFISFSYKKTNKIPPPPPPMNDTGTIIQIKKGTIIVKMKPSCNE